MHPVLVGREWRPANAVGEFSAHDPNTGESLDEKFPISDWVDCDLALTASAAAAEELDLTPPDSIAEFLESYAQKIDDAAQDLSELASRETGLPVSPRLLEVEVPRTNGQLRQAAAAARSGVWREPVHDESSDLHTCYGPLGPVMIFGPNNFPFAFNAISGGDFAAAIAAGNPVIAKAHPDHPGTTRMLAELAHAAASEAGLPDATVQLLYGMGPDDGLRMVGDQRLSAISFTGSRPSGMKLKAAAEAGGVLAYLEMSSVNPVFFLPGALREEGSKLAQELAGSCLLGTGQFCTCPNLCVLVAGDDCDHWLSEVSTAMADREPGVLLSIATLRSLERSVAALAAAGASVVTGGARLDAPGYRYQNTLLSCTGETFLASPSALQSEAFGPATLAVVAADEEQAVSIARAIEGSLTACIYSATDGSDDQLSSSLMTVLRRKAGRLLNDKMPTGVAVSPAMNHGGPFPATGHPGFTAVGMPAAIRRFAKLDCYDAVRPERLPACLRTPA
ncbi:Alpha-ketoglutaric semialdehyde dehydrogenase [Posidoniimonas polymericola]|uniref:Alpha-ketoglutaric semialdehyde dehydrogenase n=1 Tax=Posidoniimonas polymericola TaxID=2528002 RepID=A0A5C5YLJ8_9BACT|nr:aldehyde dehydrogenase family protein [Posidoniimonas polymericola]TWT75716.1 Alpha-ketoglutaric semialdehyde dehydrogenase [Posidoniimonas polymericola]